MIDTLVIDTVTALHKHVMILTYQCFQPPPLRLFLLGPKGAGKTTVGRDIAAKLGVFHVGFREYLQEQILPKMKKPPLIDDDEWEHEEENEGTCTCSLEY